MGFNLYRHQVLDNLRETYEQPERLVLSGPNGPLALYVQSLYKDKHESDWDLSELELCAMLRPGADVSQFAILFENGSVIPEQITIQRLLSIHGRSNRSETEVVVHFKSLITNLTVPSPAVFRQKFETCPAPNQSDIYENLKLSGGTAGGTWRWMESEQILNASVIAPPATRTT